MLGWLTTPAADSWVLLLCVADCSCSWLCAPFSSKYKRLCILMRGGSQHVIIYPRNKHTNKQTCHFIYYTPERCGWWGWWSCGRSSRCSLCFPPSKMDDDDDGLSSYPLDSAAVSDLLAEGSCSSLVWGGSLCVWMDVSARVALFSPGGFVFAMKTLLCRFYSKEEYVLEKTNSICPCGWKRYYTTHACSSRLQWFPSTKWTEQNRTEYRCVVIKITEYCWKLTKRVTSCW